MAIGMQCSMSIMYDADPQGHDHDYDNIVWLPAAAVATLLSAVDLPRRIVRVEPRVP